MCARTRHSFCGIRKRNKNARNFPLDPRNFPFDPRNFQFDTQNFQNFRKFHFSLLNEKNGKKMIEFQFVFSYFTKSRYTTNMNRNIPSKV